MMYHKLTSGIMAILLVISVMPDVNGEGNDSKSRENYAELKKMYDKWDIGLFGSRKLYRNRLYRLLTDMIGRDIHTGQDYIVSIPDIFEKKHYSSDLYNQNWLHIHGTADDSSIKWFAEKGNSYVKEVERNKYLFFLSGRVEKFRIVETAYGRNVHLYLEKVKITDNIK